MFYMKLAVFGLFTAISLLEIFLSKDMFLAIAFGLIGLTFLQDSRKS